LHLAARGGKRLVPQGWITTDALDLVDDETLDLASGN
jgi:hypothetical protein